MHLCASGRCVLDVIVSFHAVCSSLCWSDEEGCSSKAQPLETGRGK